MHLSWYSAAEQPQQSLMSTSRRSQLVPKGVQLTIRGLNFVFPLSKRGMVVLSALIPLLVASSVMTAPNTREFDNAPGDHVSAAEAAMFVAKTSAGRNQVGSKGEQARLLNASLPLSEEPLEAAKPFVLTPDSSDYAVALLCLGTAIYREAGFEPLPGRRAVAQVVLNRMRHPAFPKSICGVVYQGAGSPVCQFSFACDGSRYGPPAAAAWRESMNIAAAALAGTVEPSVGTATHYHADYVAPRWGPLLPKVAQLSTHIFYRWPGQWGRRAAFRGRYGGESDAALNQRGIPVAELTALTAMKYGRFQAMGVLEFQGGEIVADIVKTNAAKGGPTPLKASELPFDGSSGKPITVTLISRLVERGLLSWDMPLAHLVPELVSTNLPEYNDVTLIELLSHRGGLPATSDSEFIKSFHEDNRALPQQRLAYLQRVLSEEPAEPRGVYRYSDIGFLAAAAAAERITGRSFEDLVHAEVFEPLGIRTAELRARRVGQRSRQAASGLFSARSGDPPMWSPAGTIPMSMGDFGSFVLDLMQGQRGGGKLLKPRSYRFIYMRPPVKRGSRSSPLGWDTRYHDALQSIQTHGSRTSAISIDSAGLNAVVIIAESAGKNPMPALDRALTTVRTSWRRTKRGR